MTFDDTHATTVIVDLDGPTAEYMEGLQRYLRSINHRSGFLPCPTDYNLHNPVDGWFESREEFLEHHGTAVSQGLYANLSVVPGAIGTLNALRDQGFTIAIVTHRLLTGQDDIEKASTIEFLEKNKIPHDSIEFTDDKGAVPGAFAVDDAPSMLHKLHDAGKHVMVWDTAYNQHVTIGQRVNTWSHVYQAISALNAARNSAA